MIFHWAAILLIFFSGAAYAEEAVEGTDGAGALKTVVSEGNNRTPLRILVGSTTSVSPFASWPFNPQTELKSITIQNPAAADLEIATFPFKVADQAVAHWFVLKDSGSWTTTNHATFYMLLPPGSGSDTIKGYINRQ